MSWVGFTYINMTEKHLRLQRLNNTFFNLYQHQSHHQLSNITAMDEETTKPFEWPSVIFPLCFTLALGFMALSYPSVKSEPSRSVYVAFFALLLAFLILFASKLISDKLPFASQVTEIVSYLPGLKFASWATN